MKPLALTPVLIDKARAVVDSTDTPGMACKEGCTWCCQAGGPRVPLAELRLIVSRLEDYDLEAAARRPGCPFFNNGCTIYPERPIRCRACRSTDAMACAVAGDRPPYHVLDCELLLTGEALSNAVTDAEGEAFMGPGLEYILEEAR